MELKLRSFKQELVKIMKRYQNFWNNRNISNDIIF